MVNRKGIDPESIEITQADESDPVVQKLSWQPLKPGGSNFRMSKTLDHGDFLIIQRTFGALLFALVFAVPGTIALLSIPSFLFQSDYSSAGFMAVWGSMFAGGGFFLLNRSRRFVFDMAKGLYYRGKLVVGSEQDINKQGYLSDIHAIQILRERVNDNGSSSSFTSYELNLILKSGERVNLMDQSGVEHAARTLAAALNVPVWFYDASF